MSKNNAEKVFTRLQENKSSGVPIRENKSNVGTKNEYFDGVSFIDACRKAVADGVQNIQEIEDSNNKYIVKHWDGNKKNWAILDSYTASAVLINNGKNSPTSTGGEMNCPDKD